MSCYHYGILRAFGVKDRRRRVVFLRELDEHQTENTVTTNSHDTNDSENTPENNSNCSASSNTSRLGARSKASTSTDTVTGARGSISCDTASSVETRNRSSKSSSITTTDDNNNKGDSDGNTKESPPKESGSMDENARVEEKLQQFKNDNTRENSEDTQGTYSLTSQWEKQRRRNLIFDEERFEETFLKCLICREMYNEVDKLPKMLHCHHTFCMDCLYQMYRVEGEFRQTLTGVFRGMPMTVKIQCPTCREGALISEAELRRLPNDHTIMELLCFVSQTGRNDVQYCTKHQMQPLNFFCEPCIAPVCCDCTVIDHKESKGHVVVNVDEAMKKYTPIVEETLEDINSEKTSLAEKREALQSALEDLEQIQKNLNTQIRVVFDQIREVLSERERELCDVSESEIDRKREILHEHLKVLNDRDSQLDSQFNELQKAKEDKDISLIFTGHKSAREVLSSQVNIPTNTTKGFSVTFQFSSRADTTIKQQIANLGDIIFQS